MKAVSITGFKNSGKTGLTLLLASALEQQGARVAVIKRVHHSLDKPGTDTARLCAPGRTVVGLSETETAIFWGEERPLEQVLPLLDVDIVLLEGAKNRHWLPRILCLRDASEAEALHAGLAFASFGVCPAPELPHFDEKSIHQLARLTLEKAFALPGLDCHACAAGAEDGCLGLARAIVRGGATVGECTSLHSAVRLRVNGQAVALNPFTAGILGGAVRGMLHELKGISPGKVELELDF